MSWPLVQVSLLVSMTHAVRAVGDRLGPRWGALVLGLPSTTAVLLVGGGCESGADTATRGAEAGLLGLVATVALPLAYAWAARRGWGVPATLAAGVLAYLGVATLLLAAPDVGPWVAAAVALVGVGVACRMADRLPRHDGPARAGLALRSIVLRSAVPAVFVMANRGLRAAAGPDCAGAFATFPAMSLAVLVSIHLESGRGAAVGMARSMPRGNLLMVAFLISFRAACPAVGPLGSAAVGYLAVLATMAVLVRPRISNRPMPIRPCGLRVDARSGIPPRAPRGVLRFAPRIEVILG